MSAEQKAKEMIESFWHKISGVPESCGIEVDSQDTYVILARDCAIRCVDEILTIQVLNDEDVYVHTPNYRNYWLDVKEAIQKL